MEEKYLRTKSRIFYRKNKFNSKKKTLVFVHGLSGSSSAWTLFEKKFEKKFNILTFDLRGHGKSFRPEKYLDYSIRKYSEDIHKLLRHEKINNFIFIGHSFGNLIVLDFLKRYQKMVEAVIFVSVDYAPSKRRSKRMITPLFWIKPLLTLINERYKEGRVDYSNYKKTGDWNLRRMYADIKNTGLKSYLYSLEHALNFDAEDFLSKIKIPVLIIHGNKDTIFSISYAKEMASKITNCKFKIIDKADHIIPLNYFNRLSNEIKKFAEAV